jgi:hypothetical protein
MTQQKFSLLFLTGVLGLASLASAVSGPEHRSLRPLGMGNAFVAVVDDKEALYYNPAGLNLINALGNPNRRPNQAKYPRNRLDARMNAFGTAVPLEESGPFWRFFKKHEESFKSVDAAQDDSTLRSDMAPIDHRPINLVVLHGFEFAMNNYGGAYWLDAQVSPYIDGGLAIPHPGIETMTLDAVIQLAMAHGFMRQRLSVGAGYKIVSRQTVENFKVTASDMADEESREELEASVKDTLYDRLGNLLDYHTYGQGVDVGVLWQQTPWVRFGAAVQNFGMYLDHEYITPEVTVGVAFTPPMLTSGGGFGRKVNIAIDYEDLLNDERNYKPLSKLNFGAEVEQYGWHVLSARLAGGFKGGYWSAGAGLSFFDLVHLEAATWADEKGYYTGQVEDRLYAVNIAIGF